MRRDTVAVIKTSPFYPEDKLYMPCELYPEYIFKDTWEQGLGHVYHSVRNLLYHLALDADNYGSPQWNPLGTFIAKGNYVVIKPNMVQESHLFRPEDHEYIITHGAVLRAICDYVIIALQGQGGIVFADSPETDADFDLICKRNGLYDLVDYYEKNVSGISFKVLDLRTERWLKRDGVIIKKWNIAGDPNGYTRVPLNESSEFIGHVSNHDYYGATFDRKETQKHHHGIVHEYLISRSVLDSDVVINVPKLKTHKKAGLTCCLKNLVGINGDKNWLPHHTEGTPKKGGDQFPRDTVGARLEFKMGSHLKSLASRSRSLSHILSRLKPMARQFFGSTEMVIRSGNWYGNDTVWRMILDLNKAIFFYNQDGTIRNTGRKMFCLVDAVIGGDGIGPLHADPKPLGFLLGGFDPAAVDRVCARLVGFDYKKIPSIRQAFRVRKLGFTQSEDAPIYVTSNWPEFAGELESLPVDPDLQFSPHFGWKGHIELRNNI